MPSLADRVAALQEIDRRECFADPCVALERHFEIEDPDGTVIPLRLWGFQRDAIRTLHDDGLVIVLKARRLGLSWIYLAYALWLAITQQGVRVLILCKTEGDAAELLDRIRRMKDRIADAPASAHLLAGLQQPRKSRDHVTALDVGASTIKALVGTPAAARSETAGLILADEFAFQKRAGEIWRALLPTAEGGGRIAAVSTGNGGPGTATDGAEFADQWTRANAGGSDFRALFFPWQNRPDRDEAWKQRTIELLGDPDRFRTEYPEEPADAFVSPDVEFVYNTAHVDAAERLGRLLDAQREAGTLAPPADGGIQLGIDWGIGTTASVIVWPLAGGGIYIPPGEVIAERGEPAQLTRRMLDAAARYDWPLTEARYDAAGAQQMQTFATVAPESVGIFRVDFNRRKRRTIGFLRQLLRRTHEGHDTRVLAISPQNTVLLQQLRGLRLNDKGDVVKEADHAPDALIAGAWPVAAEFPDLDHLEVAA